MSRIPEFQAILERVHVIHVKKNEDYASEADPFENFKRSAELMSWFSNPTDKGFVSLIGTKMARLATLLDSGREPNNESIEDSFVDLITYCILWAAWRKRNELNLVFKEIDTCYICDGPLIGKPRACPKHGESK